MELWEEYVAREWRHGCCSRTKKRWGDRASECELKQNEGNAKVKRGHYDKRGDSPRSRNNPKCV